MKAFVRAFGFLHWIGISHYLNLLLVGFTVRSGLKILSAHLGRRAGRIRDGPLRQLQSHQVPRQGRSAGEDRERDSHPARRGPRDFDAGAARKYLLDPHGLLKGTRAYE